MAVTDLRDFILEEMRKRGNISARAFAILVGVSPATINAQINKTADPSMQFLRQLAKTTGVSIQILIALAYPDVGTEMGIDPQMMLLARRLAALPQPVLNIIERIMQTD